MNFVSPLGTANVLESGMLTPSSKKHSVADFPQNVVQSLTKIAITSYHQGGLWVSNCNCTYLVLPLLHRNVVVWLEADLHQRVSGSMTDMLSEAIHLLSKIFSLLSASLFSIEGDGVIVAEDTMMDLFGINQSELEQ